MRAMRVCAAGCRVLAPSLFACTHLSMVECWAYSRHDYIRGVGHHQPELCSVNSCCCTSLTSEEQQPGTALQIPHHHHQGLSGWHAASLGSREG